MNSAALNSGGRAVFNSRRSQGCRMPWFAVFWDLKTPKYLVLQNFGTSRLPNTLFCNILGPQDSQMPCFEVFWGSQGSQIPCFAVFWEL
eukprot:1128383-Amphidinium_carterae.3